jgi:AbrB family looped-hinge helix DNA binding protein
MNALATTKLSSKGQVVIPEEIRLRLGLEPGTRFLVLAEDDVVVLKTVAAPTTASFQALVRKARKAAAQAGMTEADVRSAIRVARKAS